MIALGNAIRKFITVGLALLSMLFPGSFGVATQDYAPVDADKCLLNFVAVSDSHIRADGMGGYNDMLFDLVMNDINGAGVKPDAMVFAGDITDNGEEDEWQYFQGIMEKYDTPERLLFAVGNHDTWTEESEKSAKELFIEYNKKITGKKISNIYYSTKVNGYSFIVLGSEQDHTDAFFSNKQLKWLASEMKSAAKSGKPIFVVSHWPLNKTHGLPVTWGDEEYTDMTGGMGEQSDKVFEILNKYKNVFLISGHIHSGFSNEIMAESNGYQSVEKHGNITSVNLPVVSGGNINGHFMIGTGYNVEVYKDKVIFRARSYAAGCWLPGYDYTIELK